MAHRHTIIISLQDMASVNVRDNLFRLARWSAVYDSPDYKVYKQEGFDMVEIPGRHIYQDGLDRGLEAIGYKPDIIIFASKHRSKENIRTLTVHHTGNIGENKFGGRTGELAMAAPRTAASLLRNLKSSGTLFNISYEATHHGPTDLSTPSVYIEIGSTVREWTDPDAGATIAKAILDVHEDMDMPVYVGIGGNHYAPRETALTLDTGVAFGHIIPDYAIAMMLESTMRQAFEKSGTKTVYIDRKSVPRDHRKRIEDMIVRLGYEMHTEADIRSATVEPWLKCPKLADIAMAHGLQPRPRFTESLRNALTMCRPESCSSCQFWAVAEIDETLICMAWRADRERVNNALSSLKVAYFCLNNGCPSGVLVSIDKDTADDALRIMIMECVKILESRYEVKHDSKEGLIHIIDKRFDPRKAKALGVPEGPLFGQLAKGKHVTINERVITPDMVSDENIITIQIRLPE